jgi:glycerol uptake facilitator protein
VLAVGLSLGGPSGYAINPARDLGPRLLGQLVGTQGLFDTSYWLIPIIFPIIGGVIGIFLYDWLVAANLPKPQPAAQASAAADD